MKAMICRQWGGPEDLRLEDVERPALKPGQVRLKVRAAGVSFATTLVIAGALASNDFEKVHHDRDVARAQGFRDIILSIITTTGLISRTTSALLSDQGQLRGISLRLGSPAWAGDSLTFRCQPLEQQSKQFRITGDTQRGQHVSAIVTLL